MAIDSWSYFNENRCELLNLVNVLEFKSNVYGNRCLLDN